jgi:hypothetical protein
LLVADSDQSARAQPSRGLIKDVRVWTPPRCVTRDNPTSIGQPAGLRLDASKSRRTKSVTWHCPRLFLVIRMPSPYTSLVADDKGGGILASAVRLEGVVAQLGSGTIHIVNP